MLPGLRYCTCAAPLPWEMVLEYFLSEWEQSMESDSPRDAPRTAMQAEEIGPIHQTDGRTHLSHMTWADDVALMAKKVPDFEVMACALEKTKVWGAIGIHSVRIVGRRVTTQPTLRILGINLGCRQGRKRVRQRHDDIFGARRNNYAACPLFTKCHGLAGDSGWHQRLPSALGRGIGAN